MPRIVVLGWDPLVEEPGKLPLGEGGWREDGPRLPVELCRLTPRRFPALSLCRGAVPQQVYWAYMGTDSVGEAVWFLAQAAECKPENVGFLDLCSGEYWCRTVDEHLETLRRWAEEKGRAGDAIEVIIWNDLKPDFEKKARRELTPENVVAYLRGLRPEFREAARLYLAKVPPRIDTPVLAAVRASWNDIFSRT